MLFAPDTTAALQFLAELVNTGRQSAGEGLRSSADLRELFDRYGFTGRFDGDDAELRTVRELRKRLELFWSLDEDEVVELLNSMLRDAHALPYLVKHDVWDYHLHATMPSAPLADRLSVEAAMAIADVVRQKELPRLQVCAADDCRDVLVDLTKNRSRRFCDTNCANRTNVAAYRARRAGRG